MTTNTHEIFVFGPGFRAFMTGVPDKCDHDDKGDVVYQSASGKTIYWHTYRQWASLTTQARYELIHNHHVEINDPIVMACGSCSKCKKTMYPSMY